MRLAHGGVAQAISNDFPWPSAGRQHPCGRRGLPRGHQTADVRMSPLPNLSPVEGLGMRHTHTKRSPDGWFANPERVSDERSYTRADLVEQASGIRGMQSLGDEGGSRVQAKVEAAVVRDSWQCRLLQQDHGRRPSRTPSPWPLGRRLSLLLAALDPLAVDALWRWHTVRCRPVVAILPSGAQALATLPQVMWSRRIPVSAVHMAHGHTPMLQLYTSGTQHTSKVGTSPKRTIALTARGRRPAGTP